jgi:hypothetical protein
MEEQRLNRGEEDINIKFLEMRKEIENERFKLDELKNKIQEKEVIINN